MEEAVYVLEDIKVHDWEMGLGATKVPRYCVFFQR